jgi:hypothetical protein
MDILTIVISAIICRALESQNHRKNISNLIKMQKEAASILKMPT